MTEPKRDEQGASDRERDIARELFTSERGSDLATPFETFLSRIQAKAHEQVQRERRSRPRP